MMLDYEEKKDMEKVVIDDIDLIVNLVIKRLDNKPYELPSIVGYYETI